MFKKKRKFPSIMIEAEKHIEQWRASLLKQVHPRLDIAIYLLVSTACSYIGYETKRQMPHNVAILELFIREMLFGLQFALSGLEGNLPEGCFIEDFVVDTLNAEDVRRAFEAIQYMSHYAQARDIFLTYAWGEYELENPTKRVLRFVDPPGWTGSRDRAQQIINQKIKEDEALSALTQLFNFRLIKPIHLMLEQIVEVPLFLSFGNLTATQFASAWLGLTFHFSPYWLNGQTLIIDKKVLIGKVQRIANLSFSETERFINLVTFDRRGPAALTLFHCPLVPVTTSSFLVVTPGFIFGNPSTCIPRLAIHRGPGLDIFAKNIERHLLNKLKTQFEIKGVTINLNIPYSGKDDKGDLDLVVYEAASNRLLIAQVKGFIHPDTVEEVVRANQAIKEGLHQVERARRWLKNLPFSQWAGALKLPLSQASPKVRFAVIGNGFTGSDYIQFPNDVSCADARYLLLPKFTRKSIFYAIESYEKLLSEESKKATKNINFNSFKLADITIEIPSWKIHI